MDESQEDLEKSTEWIFQGYLFFSSNGWRTDETYEAEVRAVVEQQYLPKVPVPVQHMAIFYDSVAKPDRDVLKLPIRGYVQANSASRQQWRKWIDAAELEWEKAHGGILYNKWYLLDCQETYTGNPKRLLLRHGQYQNFRVNGTAWTFSCTICADRAGDESCYLVEITSLDVSLDVDRLRSAWNASHLDLISLSRFGSWTRSMTQCLLSASA